MTPLGALRQRGAIAVLVAFALVALLLMVGLVLDLGHLYVVKNELQDAADACALSGARELNDLSAGALDRATAAAVVTGNRNLSNFQKEQVAVLDEDVTFGPSRDGPFTRAVNNTTGFVRCAPHESNPKSIAMWFMSLAGPAAWDVSAEAVAARVPGQSLCAIPIALCTRATHASDLVPGTWYSGRLAAGTATTGNYDWVRFPGNSGAADLGDIVAGGGMCDVATTRVNSEPGVTTGVAEAWNTRFGLYAGKYKDPVQFPPDRTGYAYTPLQLDNRRLPMCPGGVPSGTWPQADCSVPPNPIHAAPQNAYGDYVARGEAHDPYDPNSLLGGNGRPLVLPGNPSPSPPALHARGRDRRMVYVPVISCDSWESGKRNIAVLDWACALMLAPVDDPKADVQLEFRGLRTGGCGTTGYPGGTGAPVPALVK